MAIPTRIDGAATPGRTLGRRPIVLARLPYVGAESGVESRELSVESQEAVNQEEGPGLALSPQLPSESLSESPRKEPSKRRRMKRISGSQKSRPITTFQQQSQSAAPSTFLFTLHSQLAPFAGAIVALALIASAGLLYWMIVSPSRVPIDFHKVGQQGFEAGAVELPKFVPELPSFASRTNVTTVAETPVFDMPEWDADKVVAEVSPEPLEETPAIALQEKELVVSLEAPAISSTIEPTPVDATEQIVSPAVGPVFPTTGRPTALDFTKLAAVAEGETQANSPPSKPAAEVAGRSVPQVLIPTRR